MYYIIKETSKMPLTFNPGNMVKRNRPMAPVLKYRYCCNIHT